MSDRLPLLPLGRRTLIKTGIAAGAAALMPWADVRAQQRPQVARSRTVVVAWGGREGSWVDWDLWNPYAIGSDPQNGLNLIYEPLAYYSAFSDRTYMWLAEAFEFAADFKRLSYYLDRQQLILHFCPHRNRAGRLPRLS